jgi:hypothetical protein
MRKAAHGRQTRQLTRLRLLNAIWRNHQFVNFLVNVNSSTPKDNCFYSLIIIGISLDFFCSSG